ncbi:hypothetical protein ACIP6X_22310 [Streptomyces coeruleorubidus]|uniref:hypothetical protein n=1 Tax=Streptomyces coeruleorubidus TaxID=116188 RepID=UPI00382F233C
MQQRAQFFQFVRDSAGPDLLEPGRTTFFTNDWLHLDDPTEQGILGTAYYAENANTVAEVHVPTRTRSAVTEGGRPAEAAKGVRFLRMEDGAAVFEVGSGS